MDKKDLEWIEKQEKLTTIGDDIVKRASDEALGYVQDAIENIHDKQWRKMAIESQAVEMGVGISMAEHLIPAAYKDMEKNLHKKLKVHKDIARAIRHIYIGRVIKNIRKELNKDGLGSR